ncbi:ankyrin repeat domain-containing protein [Spirosoma sp. BT702]|uniref:Ankyrin repeat domain-containing protein n=1 Tax=Spirosoma profusum TaxID=2771354 RepID=A0A926XZ36_9BACT|nr:ankyrin repeat domain-containing protein [Spirosoma profusum]MBD2702886.1 ankyrin repeat domain-containing protein [Spirosoma profusum]
MKTLVNLNWVIIGLYSLLLVYMFIGSNSPNNDAAGRGMLSGFVFLLLLFVGLLVFLNLRESRFAIITVSVLGGLPMLLMGTNLIFERIKEGRQSEEFAKEQEAKANGTYYFQDSAHQQAVVAIMAGDTSQLRQLLAAPFSKINESGTNHTTLLDIAASKAAENPTPQAYELLDVLLEHGATFKTDDTLRQATQLNLYWAKPEFIEWLLKHGADPNVQNTPDSPPFLFSMLGFGSEDRLERVNLLLRYGANPNAINPASQWSILLEAANQQAWEVCQLLLSKGADPTYKIPQGQDFKDFLQSRADSYKTQQTTPPAEFTVLAEKFL